MRVIDLDGRFHPVRYMDGMSAGAAVRAAGLSPEVEGSVLTVDGRKAGSHTPVGPDSTVARSPRPSNG